eukprot:jgi/Psemu1/19367/gm1.19367_g
MSAPSRNHKLSRILLSILIAAASHFLHDNVVCWAAEAVGSDDAGVSTTASASALPSLLSEVTSCEVTAPRTKARPCPDPVQLKLSYVSGGAVDCGGALTSAQANIAPQVKVADSTIVDPAGLYALVLVDTTRTTNSEEVDSATMSTTTDFDSIRPILHYGAVNIPGSSLLAGLSLDRSDHFDVFSAYRGPASPSLLVTDPRVVEGDDRDQSHYGSDNPKDLWVYEFFLGAQPGGEDPIVVPEELADGSPLGFDYEEFFDETVGIGFENITATTHFRSGSCVRDPIVTIREKEEDDLSTTEDAEENPPPSDATTSTEDAEENPPPSDAATSRDPTSTQTNPPSPTTVEDSDGDEPERLDDPTAVIDSGAARRADSGKKRKSGKKQQQEQYDDLSLQYSSLSSTAALDAAAPPPAMSSYTPAALVVLARLLLEELLVENHDQLPDDEDCRCSHKKTTIPSIVTIMPSTGGRKPGIGNYTKAELENMFAAIRAIVPCGGDDWEDVADLHAKKFPGRDSDLIRSKFNRLHRKKAPTGNPTMRWDIKEAKELFQMIGTKSRVIDGEDVYDVETDEFTPPPPPPPPPDASTQPVPLLLGQPTQLTQPTQPTQPTQEVTQFEEVSTISTSRKRHYNNRKGEEFKMMNTIAQVLKLQQQALEQQQRYQDQQQQYQKKADEERKVLMQAVLAIGGSGSGGVAGTAVAGTTSTPSSASAVGGRRPSITPQILTTPQVTNGKLKRKVNSLQQHPDYSSDDDISDSSSDDDLLGTN